MCFFFCYSITIFDCKYALWGEATKRCTVHSPFKENDPHATNAISHFALYFIEVFGIKFFLVFNNNSNVIKKELCDIICSHWQSY